MYNLNLHVMRSIGYLLLIAACLVQCKKTENQAAKPPFERPKLVVGIVVDQMRYDYLTRFWDKYSEKGFKRLVRDGFTCKNNHFNYVPTYTGPGHASIYTGATPSVHGIIANDWFDRDTNAMMYCAQDDSVKTIGSTDVLEAMSPKNLKVTTVTDQLRLATQLRGKVVGIALKDRGAILPAGHTGNAAYWFHGKKEGKWVSSSYYMAQLPRWVQDFNQKGAEKYLTEWNTLYNIATYTEAGTDGNTFERLFKGETQSVFPHDSKKLAPQNDDYDIIKNTPSGNVMTTDFALAAIDGEKLGADEVTDFLAISYSSTDYIGHRFGVNSIETEDAYLRLDLDIARLLEALDAKVGKDNYTLFLTADHGGVEVPAYWTSLKIPAGYFDEDSLAIHLKDFLKRTFGKETLLKQVVNEQIFLDRNLLTTMKLNPETVQKAVAAEIAGLKEVEEVYTATDMSQTEYTQGMKAFLQKGFHPKRSGDVLYVLSHATVPYPKQGSTHGSAYTYDTHVPLLFYGKGIRPGATAARTEITDIAPTIATLIGIAFPSGATGNPIAKAFR